MLRCLLVRTLPALKFHLLQSFLLFLYHFSVADIEKNTVADWLLFNRWHTRRGKDSPGLSRLLGSLGDRDQEVWVSAEAEPCFCTNKRGTKMVRANP